MNEKENEIILYQPDSTLTLDVRVENDTVWLTQAQMTDLFMRDRTVITRHINNIFREKELDEDSNVHFLHIANYFIGGSIKDLGKKIVAFCRMNQSPDEIVSKLR